LGHTGAQKRNAQNREMVELTPADAIRTLQQRKLMRRVVRIGGPRRERRYRAQRRKVKRKREKERTQLGKSLIQFNAQAQKGLSKKARRMQWKERRGWTKGEPKRACRSTKKTSETGSARSKDAGTQKVKKTKKQGFQRRPNREENPRKRLTRY